MWVQPASSWITDVMRPGQLPEERFLFQRQMYGRLLGADGVVILDARAGVQALVYLANNSRCFPRSLTRHLMLGWM